MSKRTREQWLGAVAADLAPTFRRLGYPLPTFRISTGFTGNGRKSRAVAQVWTDKLDRERRHQIFIDPRSDDTVDVINSVAHELIHAAVGLQHGHTGPFVEVALALGMQRPMPATPSGPAFVALAEGIVKKIGPYPHARLEIGYSDPDAGAGPATDPTPAPAPQPTSSIVTSGPKPQRARLIKASCRTCGYNVRLTRKWIEQVGLPHCPNHGEMPEG